MSAKNKNSNARTRVLLAIFFASFLLLSPFILQIISLFNYIDFNVYENEYYWDFRNGFPPDYSGWGTLELVSEGIQISDTAASYCGLIFTPFRHNPEWQMETLVEITKSDYHAGEINGAVAILTRDSSKVNCESTLGLYPNTTVARCRHKINGIDELGYQDSSDGGITFSLPFKFELNTWYKLRFFFHKGNLECYINDTKYFEQAGLSVSSTVYTQPHLGIYNGTAVFQYIKIWNFK